MTWTMSASGHTPAPEGSDGWAEVEQRLHDELSAVLAKPEYGAGTSFFHGNHVDSNSLHVAQDSPEVEHVRETGGKTGGQCAYEAYSKHVGGISVNGDELPGWADQLGGIREAWEVAAAAGAPGGFHVSAGPATSVASGAVTTQVVGSLP